MFIDDLKSALIPKTISAMYSKGEKHSEFYGSVISLDIKGFTPLTEALISIDSGAEILSDIINGVYEKAIDVIFKNGGFISAFAGDAFMAIFPNDELSFSLNAAKEIQRYIENNNTVKTIAGTFKLSLRIGVANGIIKAGIISDRQSVYFFYGDAIKNASFAQSKAKDEINVLRSKAYYDRKIMLTQKKADRDTLKKFIPDSVLELKSQGEFRNIVSAFISFKNDEDIEKNISIIIENVFKYGGFLNKVDYGDKEWIALCIFGAPLSVEKPEQRACEFSLELTKNCPNLKVGISKGLAFSGFIGSKRACEYTCLGRVVNLSARISQYGKENEVLVVSDIENKVKNMFEIINIGSIKFKGFDEKHEVFSVKGTLTKKYEFSKGSLFGRDAELKKIKESIQSISSMKILYIDGPAGIGKSRLVEEVKRGIDTEHYKWIFLPCDEIIKGSFNPFEHFLHKYFNCSKEFKEKVNRENFESNFVSIVKNVKNSKLKDELIRTKTILAALLQINYPNSLLDQLDSKGKHDNMISSLKNLILLVSERTPLVIEIDDAQWIDDDSLLVLSEIERTSKDKGILIIAECRSTDEGKQFELGLKDLPNNRLNLTSIDISSISRILEERTGIIFGDNVIKIILEKSEGNPFYVEQIGLYLKERPEDLKKADLGRTEFILPSDISSVVISRIDKLSSELKDIIRTASVLGKEFSVKVLSAMLQGRRSLKKEITQIEQESIWSAISEIVYVFKHAMIREAVYKMQLNKTLRGLHLLAARKIEELFSDDLHKFIQALAYHYEKAQVQKKAAHYLVEAGNISNDNYRNNEAIDLFERSLKFLKGVKKRELIKIQIASIFTCLVKYKEAEEILLKCIDDLENKRYRSVKAKAMRILAHIYWKKGDYNNGIKYGSLSYDLFNKMNDLSGMRAAIQELGYSYFYTNDIKKCIECFEKQLEIAQKMKNDLEIGIAYDDLGFIYNDRGDFNRALSFHLKYLSSAKKIRSKVHMKFAFMSLGNINFSMGRFEKALYYYKKVNELAVMLGDVFYIGFSLFSLGNSEHSLGNYKSSIDYLEKSFELSNEADNELGLIYIYCIMAKSYFGLSDIKRSEHYFEIALNIAERLNIERGICYVSGNYGAMLKLIGKYEKSEVILQNAITISEKHGLVYNKMTYSLDLADLYVKMGNPEKGKKYIELAVELGKNINNKSVVFYIILVNSQYKAFKNKSEGIKILELALKKYRKPTMMAQIYLKMYEISRDKATAKRSLELYEGIPKEKRDYLIQKCISFLKDALK